MNSPVALLPAISSVPMVHGGGSLELAAGPRNLNTELVFVNDALFAASEAFAAGRGEEACSHLHQAADALEALTASRMVAAAIGQLLRAAAAQVLVKSAA